jgi:very-short-patch-repair endonuclease
MAAFLWAGEGSYVSHRSAAQLLGLEGGPSGHVEVAGCLARAKRHDVTLHRVTQDDRPRTRPVGSFLVTPPERTIMDLCSVVPAAKAGKVMDDALRKKLTTLDRLQAEAQERGRSGRNGAKVFRRLISFRDDRDGKLESDLEAALLRLLRTPLLPKVDVQHVVSEAGSHPPRLDFAYPVYRVGVEGHSFRHHGGLLKAWNSDWMRDNRLKVFGWTVLYYSWDEIHFEGERVIADIGRLLRGRGAPLLEF